LRLVKLAQPDGNVAAYHNRAITGFHNDDLHAWRVPWRGDEPYPGEEDVLTLDRDILHAGRVDPFAKGGTRPCCCGRRRIPGAGRKSACRPRSPTNPRMASRSLHQLMVEISLIPSPRSHSSIW
jgi:hypothetical protein